MSQVPYVFRQESEPKFRLRLALGISVLLILLGIWLSEKSPWSVFSLSAAELAQLAQREEPEDLVFRFLNTPEDQIEPKPDAVNSDVNRVRKAPVVAPEMDSDPISEGDTYELTQTAPTPNMPAQQPSPKPTAQPPQPKEVQEQKKTEVAEAAPPIFSKDGPQPYRKPSQEEIEQSKQQASMQLTRPSNPGMGVDQTRYHNPQGGGANEIGFDIDTAGHDLGPYLKLLVQMVRSNWRRPNVSGYATGVVGVGFNLHKDGRITDVTIIKNSEHEPLDASSYNAISTIYKAPPLPGHIEEEVIPIKFGFYYNVRPPRR